MLAGGLKPTGSPSGDGFFSILRKRDLLIKIKRRYAVTTQSFHHYKTWIDLIQRREPVQAEQVGVSDITYPRPKSGFIYLFLITDALSRKIVGYHLSQSLQASGCLMALNKAVKEPEYPERPLIHHSDRGMQYSCDDYVELLQKSQINISMTQSGSPYDNAVAERINGILKDEFNLYRTFESNTAAVDPICRAIAAYYNIRPHHSCEPHTPQLTRSRESENTPKCFLMIRHYGKVKTV